MMEATSLMTTNPLGLNLDFLFGRGFLWAKAEHLRDWVSLDLLRMEIPDLSFPFDARGGLGRFRNTRCLVREIEISVSENGLRDLIARAAESLEGFEHLEVRLLDGAAHVSLKMNVMGATTYLSFKVALIPPEPPRADEIHLSLYDYRAFGPMPYASRLLAADLLTSLLDTPVLRPPGRGESFSVGVAGDILSLRPIKLLLLQLFPQVGWKLPNLSGVVLDGSRIRPGQIALRATTRTESWYQPQREGREAFEISSTLEGSRALAAYEAKDLFGAADQTIFEGDLTRALEQLATLRDIYGPHPGLVSRTLDCLLADPTPAHLTEAEILCQNVLAQEPELIEALIALPTIAALAGRPMREVLGHYDRLSEELRRRQQIDDWVLCELTVAQWLEQQSVEDALARLKGVLALAPRNLEVLSRLRHLYQSVGNWQGYEQVLKRLTGVYTDRQQLKQVYLDLAHHLMDRREEVAEARIYLEKVLRLEPGEVEALDTLGSGYVLSGQPLRALKAFSSAARAAEARDNLDRAAALYFRAAKLWSTDLGNDAEALLSCRRALELHEREQERTSILDTLEYKEWLAKLSEKRERWDEALGARTELIRLLEDVLGAPAPPPIGLALSSPLRDIKAVEGFDKNTQLHKSLRAMLIRAERDLGELYLLRGRPDAAEPHWSRVLDLAPADEVSANHLEQYYRQSGQPEQLISFFKALISRSETPLRRGEVRLKLAKLYGELSMVEEASTHLRELLREQPTWHGAREELVVLLKGSGRFETLRDTLSALLLNVQEPVARRDILLGLGDVLATQLGEARQGFRAFHEALELDPRSAPALHGCADALRRMIEQEGPRAPAPLGKDTAAMMLESILQRLVDLRRDPLDRAVTLEEIAALAQARGAKDVAKEATRRAQLLRNRGFEPIQISEVDERLDDVLVDIESETLPEVPTKPEIMVPEIPTKPEIEVPDGLGNESTVSKQDKDQDAKVEQEEPKATLDDFRAKMRGILKKPASLSAPDPDRKTILDKLRTKRSLEDLRRQVDIARQSEAPESLVKALGALIEASKEQLEAVELAGLYKELGELQFYELEQNQEAKHALEQVLVLDSKGLGEQASVLNALESIYEEEGAVEARIALLEQRLEKSDTEDLADTYRLLIAQIWWDEANDEGKARESLKAVLDRDAKNESAHRLLAQIAQSKEQWEEAVSHYEVMLSERSGGLDEVELERDLAQIYLHKLQRYAQAQKHFEKVLQAAPADARALEGIKQSQAAREDWEAYLGSLGRELGVLTANLEAFDLREPESVDVELIAQPLRQAASGILSDAAHIFEENLKDITRARQAWGKTVEMWPEDVEALEHRVRLDRVEEAWGDLADDLEAWADMLIEQGERFEALYESATLRAQKLNQPEQASEALAGAIAMVQGDRLDEEHKQLVQKARRELQAMRDKT